MNIAPTLMSNKNLKSSLNSPILCGVREKMEEKDINFYEEDEIDLIELWRTLKRHKLAISLTTLIFLIAAVIFIVTTKPEYEAVATLQIGGQLVQTGNGLTKKYFEDVNAIKEYLDVKYDVNGSYRKKGVESYIEDVSVPRKIKGFITITAYGPNNNEAIKTLKITLEDIMKRHKKYYNSIIKLYKIKLVSLKKKINFLLKEISAQKKLLKILSKKQNKINKPYPALSALITLQISQIKKNLILEKNELINTEKNINLIKSRMQPPYLTMTKIVGKIYTHNYPVKPKKKLILAVALVSGLFLGVFLAFFIEFIQRAKERET